MSLASAIAHKQQLCRRATGSAAGPTSTCNPRLMRVCNVHQIPSSSGSAIAAAPRLRRARIGVAAAAAEGGGAAAAVTTTAVAAAQQPAAADGLQLQELNQETFQPFLDAAGDKLVVVDFFTDWCGPCKLIYPQLVSLSAELAPAATIVKFNCNQANKELAKALGIKVAPTFHLYRNGSKVADMTGAKVDKLKALIDEHLSPSGGSNSDGQN